MDTGKCRFNTYRWSYNGATRTWSLCIGTVGKMGQSFNVVVLISLSVMIRENCLYFLIPQPSRSGLKTAWVVAWIFRFILNNFSSLNSIRIKVDFYGKRAQNDDDDSSRSVSQSLRNIQRASKSFHDSGHNAATRRNDKAADKSDVRTLWTWGMCHLKCIIPK